MTGVSLDFFCAAERAAEALSKTETQKESDMTTKKKRPARKPKPIQCPPTAPQSMSEAVLAYALSEVSPEMIAEYVALVFAARPRNMPTQAQREKECRAVMTLAALGFQYYCNQEKKTT